MATRGRPSVSLWHPFTARSIGWDESDLTRPHSRPHRRALAELAADHDLRVRIEYLTDRPLPRREVHDGLEVRYWPRTPWRRGATAYRSERSALAVAQARAQPASVTIINTSGHG